MVEQQPIHHSELRGLANDYLTQGLESGRGKMTGHHNADLTELVTSELRVSRTAAGFTLALALEDLDPISDISRVLVVDLPDGATSTPQVTELDFSGDGVMVYPVKDTPRVVDLIGRKLL